MVMKYPLLDELLGLQIIMWMWLNVLGEFRPISLTMGWIGLCFFITPTNIKGIIWRSAYWYFNSITAISFMKARNEVLLKLRSKLWLHGARKMKTWLQVSLIKYEKKLIKWYIMKWETYQIFEYSNLSSSNKRFVHDGLPSWGADNSSRFFWKV